MHIRKRNDNAAEKEPIEDGFSETRMYNETTLPNSSQPDQSQTIQNTKWSNKQTTRTVASRNLNYRTYIELMSLERLYFLIRKTLLRYIH